MLSHILEVSKVVIANCARDKGLKSNEAYKDLLFAVLTNTSKDNEDYIINNAERLFEDEAYKNKKPYFIIELYDYVVYVLCQKQDFNKAQKYLSSAKSFAKAENRHYIWGKYYDMLTDFYEELLNGAYYTDDTDEQKLMQKLMQSTEKCIYHMKNSKHSKAYNLYIKYMLDKINLMIRAEPEKKIKIRNQILTIKKLIDKDISEYSKLRTIFYLACAWYYTLCEANEQKVCYYLRESASINEYNNISDLDKVDYYYIPAANMMCELYNDEKAIKWLQEAMDICQMHKGVIPYDRKYKDLLEYMNEIMEGENSFPCVLNMP